MNDKLYIKKFIRDDGEMLSFDGQELYLAKDNVLLVRPDPNTTSVEYTEADGGEMVRQHNSTYEQPVNGLLIPRSSDYWDLSMTLARFFQINHTFKIIYVKKDGSMFAISDAWISTGLQIVPVPHETYSSWTITLTVGNSDWYEYAEDSQGHEIYSNTVTLPLIGNTTGGENWDAVGTVWNNVGEKWVIGAGGVQSVNIASTKPIYPLWIVEGPCVNPKLQNNTTDTNAEYDGTVAEGQTLTVDFTAGTAYLDSALVSRLVYGVVSFNPGENIAGFNSDGGTTNSSTISWNNIIS
ncbi:MAG: hypothetical protein U0L97_02855 [Candidatus Saccharimonadaceae bacterium]|nr:hypothetical protein [Candidatus Saccharimonadaceae bacterium]